MTVEQTKNKTELQHFLLQDPELHLYALGDLDDFFWPHCTYYVKRDAGEISALVLKYQPGDLPVIMALGRNLRALNALLVDLVPELPDRIYAHVSPGCEATILDDYRQTYHETQVRMIRRNPTTAEKATGDVITLTPKDSERLQTFYDLSYPQNWFDEQMLSVHPFTGVVVNHQLVSVAGLHSFSKDYQVAALGNITTHPDFRGNGYAQQCTHALCQQLERQVSLIGLNVRGDNSPAIRTYKKTGFEPVYEFSEMMLERR